MSKPLEIDVEKLTIADLELLDEQPPRIKSIVGMIARASNWTEEELRALPASKFREISALLLNSMTAELSQKN